MNSISCCSNVTRSALSSERKRYSVCVPLRRLRSLVCTIPRQLPGVTCTTFITRQRSFWCWMIMPTRSCVAGINIGSRSSWGECETDELLYHRGRPDATPAPASVHALRCVERRVHRRAVVMDEEPPPVAPFEDVGRLHLGLDLAVTLAALDALGEHDPGDVPARLRVHVAEREAHLERALEDAPPALHHRSPAGQALPAGMDARDVRRPQPDLLHAGELEALEGAVEGGVRLEHCLAVRHDGFGAMTTRSTRRSGPGFLTA